MVEEVRGGLPALEEVVFLGDGRWQELAGAAVDRDALARRAASLSFDDPINIQYTSGTTGFPKGATLSHHNILNNGFFVAELLGYTEQDRVCIPVPFYHCFGMVMGNLGCTSHGACMVIPAPAFDPEATLDAIGAERCTSLYGVPTMFIAMLEHPAFATADLGTLRTGIMAGSPCPVEVMRRVVAEMNMRDVAICYGMTETSPVSTQTRSDDTLERRVGSVGRVGPHVEVKIVDAGHRRGPSSAASRASCARAATASCSATGSSRRRPARRSTPRAGCTPATSRRWTPRATATSSAAARTWSSAAARTSTRARSRSSSTATRPSATCR